MSTMVTELVVRGASRREVRATPTHFYLEPVVTTGSIGIGGVLGFLMVS